MADVSLSVAMYDYNGSVYAFGVISGLRNVKAVRMYLSASTLGEKKTYQYLSDRVYAANEAHINTTQYPTPCYVFYIRTDIDAENNSPEQLRYDIEDENGDGYGRYLFRFRFYDNTSGAGACIGNEEYGLENTETGVPLYYQMHNSLATPKIKWNSDKKTITLSGITPLPEVEYDGNYRCMIEVRRAERWGTETEAAIRDYAYTVVMKNLESGKYWEAIPDTSCYEDESSIEDYGENEAGDRCRYRNKWNAVNAKKRGSVTNGEGLGELSVIILYDSGAKFKDEDKESYSKIVNEVLDELNQLTGITFLVESREIDRIYKSEDGEFGGGYDPTDTMHTIEDIGNTYGADADNSDYRHDIVIRVGNKSTMKGDWTGEGRWYTFRTGGSPEDGITTSVACINVDAASNVESVRHVFFEEIYQSFGLGGDNYDHPMSIHFDPEYTNPESYFTEDKYDGVAWDEEVMKFWQSRNMNGWSNIELINTMDTPCCMFKEYNPQQSEYEFDLSGLVDGEYEVYGWVAGDKTSPGAAGTSTFDYWHGGWDDSPYSNKVRVKDEGEYRIIIEGNRPAKFAWRYSKIEGGAFNLTAEEWNELTANINAVRKYKGLEPFSFTMAVTGETFTANMYNEACIAIKGIEGYGTYINMVEQGQPITAYAMNALVSELNAIP